MLRKRIVVPLLGLLALALTMAGSAQAAQKYYIGEQTDYTGNGCPNNTNLNTVTSTLRTAMANRSWTGFRFVNANAWPWDMMEENFNSSWLDDVYGDNHDAAIIAGHGFVQGNLVQNSYSANSQPCSWAQGTTMRLGTQSGNDASMVMMLNSCQGTLGMMNTTYGPSRAGQSMAYHNSPIIANNQPRDFFNATNTADNRDAWVDVMDDRSGSGWNSPMIFTQGNGSTNAWNRHTGQRMWDETYMFPMSETYTYYYYTYKNNGCGPCTGGSNCP